LPCDRFLFPAVEQANRPFQKKGDIVRILVVDDDELALEMLQFSLGEAEHELIVARDGQEALRLLSEMPCQMVISDWMMPRMSGLELCRAIRAQDFGTYVYLILLTAQDGPAQALEGLEAGADDFVLKPFDPNQLKARVRVAERLLALESRDLTIFALAKLAESRDPETGAHLERVQNYSRALASHLAKSGVRGSEIDAGFVRLIYETSPLHDIGKVAIPDFVLLKPGRLSDEEFDIMKTHTTMGAQTLEAASRKHPKARFLRMAREIAATHHEKFDGSGYPLRLAGENIPLSGRIVALADVYDALISKRVYKGAFTHAMARSIIVDGKGKHFDPQIVQGFLEIEEKFLDIQRQFSEALPLAA
jgi:putative two-component system response regulator